MSKIPNLFSLIKCLQTVLLLLMRIILFLVTKKFIEYKRERTESLLLYRTFVLGVFSPPKRGSFLQATPAQLASLIPMLRFYLIDEEGNENEIYFSDKISPRHLKKIAELKGKSIDEIINYNPEGGGETGITSFSWHYNNKHEGDYIIEADLELYFGSLVELANVEYLKFLGATGNVTDISETLKEK